MAMSCKSTINYSYEVQSLANPQNKISRKGVISWMGVNDYVIEPMPEYIYTNFKLTGGNYECPGSKPFVKGGTCERNLALEFYHDQVQYIFIEMRYVESKKGYVLDCGMVLTP